MAAPIALFVYNRPHHTKQTIEALQKNFLSDKSELYIFSDGPKGEHDLHLVNAIRTYVRNINGFKKITIFESPVNKGLANSIISGVTQLLKEYENVIVMEDDLVSSQYFLSYLNQGLELYADEESVISIHGYLMDIKNEGLPDTFFIKGADCWGWATWKRGWKMFEPNAKILLEKVCAKESLRKEFDFDDNYPYTKMLKDQLEGKIDSWAIRWYASAFINNKLTLYPRQSLISNIGFDNGTHSSRHLKKMYQTNLMEAEPILKKIETKEDIKARKRIIDYYRQHRDTFLNKLLKRIFN